jgi:Xaa-Pro aminopeptidase
VAHELEHLMRRFGARKAAFDPIVAVGPRAALPHAHPTEARLAEAPFVLIDWGAISARGYRSDLTRVLTTATIPPKVEELYRVVLTAQQTARALVRPGAQCCDVDAAARQVIEDAGFGPFFGHGLGHGIGLDIHEGPRLAATSKGELKAGMVVTIEPGLYLPDVAGVRIEDDVLVTPDGCEVLTSVPREWGETGWGG